MEGELELRRRELEPREGGDGLASLTTDLARLTWQLRPRTGDVRVRVDYQVTTEATLPRTKDIRFVGEGLGTYDATSDSFSSVVGPSVSASASASSSPTAATASMATSSVSASGASSARTAGVSSASGAMSAM